MSQADAGPDGAAPVDATTPTDTPPIADITRPTDTGPSIDAGSDDIGAFIDVPTADQPAAIDAAIPDAPAPADAPVDAAPVADGGVPDGAPTDAAVLDAGPGPDGWVRQFGTLEHNAGARRIVVDSNGNWYVAYFHHRYTYAHTPDVVLVSLSPTGATRWTRTITGRINQLASIGLGLDDRANLYVSASFQGTIDLDPGPLTAGGGPGSYDYILASYTLSGSLRWGRTASSLGLQDIWQVVGTPGGGAVISGRNLTPTTNGLHEPLVGSYSESGVQRWSRPARIASTLDREALGSGTPRDHHLAVGGEGDVVLAGSARDTADWGGGPIPARSDLDLFVTRWSAAGAHRWSLRFGDPGAFVTDVTHDDVGVDADGNIYLTGTVLGTLDFGGSPLVAGTTERRYRASLTRDGTHRWSHLGSTAIGREVLSPASDGTVVFAGRESRDPGRTMTPSNVADAVVALTEGRDRTSGGLRWRREFPTRWTVTGMALASNAIGGTLVGGTFQGTTDFGVATLRSAGSLDAFARYLSTSELASSACPAGTARCGGFCVDPQTDPAHCGACGAACASPRLACVAGACVLGSCPAGTASCDGNAANGCEADLSANAAHCGACGAACAGGSICVDGRCCAGAACEGAALVSDGHEGAFAPAADTVLAPGVHHFTTVTVRADVTVRTSGSGVLELRATGDVTLDGIIDLSGADGTNSIFISDDPITFTTGVGGATGHPGLASEAGSTGGGTSGRVQPHSEGMPPEVRPGTGGGGVAGGGAASAAVGGLAVGPMGPGGAGSGTDGGAGGACSIAYCGGFNSVWTCDVARGGRAGGAPYDGLDGSFTAGACARSSAVATTGAGGSIGTAAAGDLAMRTTFGAGSGGGGGAPYGGGGGGGGGALRITSPTSIRLGAAARLRANGGRPGASAGGGSGGAIDLRAPTIVAARTSVVDAHGGSAERSSTGPGAGGLGRVRLSVDNVAPGRCSLLGTFHPPLGRGCASLGAAGYTYVGRYPN